MPAAKHITLGISIAIVAGLVGAIVAVDVASESRAPRIEAVVQVDDAYETKDGWYTPVTLTNVGDLPIDTLRVDIVAAGEPGSMPEVSDLEFNFVAGGESVDGAVVLDERPTSESVEVDAISITEP